MSRPATLFASMAVLLASCAAGGAYEPRNGDIVFHTSRSEQSLAIQQATGSPYSHMGIVYVDDGRAYVYEAVEPVKSTPFDEWTARGEGGHFVVERLRDADEILTPEALGRMRRIGETFRGKHYDLYFEWSDERIYCSELVWKVYQRALGIELGQRQTIADFDLTPPTVRAKIHERWPAGPPPDEIVISPAAIFASNRLVVVFER